RCPGQLHEILPCRLKSHWQHRRPEKALAVRVSYREIAMEMKLFLLQRLTAMIMAPFIFVHIGVIIYAVRGGLSAEEILGRTQGNGWWIAFYTVFVVSASIHAPIGIRKVLREWARLSYAVLNPLALALGLLFLALGLRAVSAVGGLAW